MLKRLFLLSGVALIYLTAMEWEERPLVYPPGVLVPQIPVQLDLEPSWFDMKDYLVTRRAKFKIRARVLSTENIICTGNQTFLQLTSLWDGVQCQTKPCWID